VLATATVAAVAAWVAVSGGAFASVGATLAGVAAAGVAAAVVVRFQGLIPWAIAVAGVGYVAGREHQALVDGWAPVVGAALLLAAELAGWSIEHDARIRQERALLLTRIGTLAALVAASALVAFVLVGAAAVSASAGLLLTGVGVAAAVSSVAVVLRLLRT
jgi:hypothetical protein